MRVAIVNDMKLAVEAMRRLLHQSSDFSVAWVAYNGVEAVDKCQEDTPDLVLMDLNMPELGGVLATQRIMEKSPCPILIVTSSVGRMAPEVFEALGAGALDAVRTPRMGPELDGSVLLRKIKQLGRLVVQKEEAKVSKDLGSQDGRSTQEALVVIGASSGGPRALVPVIKGLPQPLRASVVIVQHIDYDFVPGFVAWLSAETGREVRSTDLGRALRPGEIAVAATEEHLILAPNGRLKGVQRPGASVYQPSIDIFFDSVAKNWSGSAIGIILTGMGSDGARGLKSLRTAGHSTIAQDEGTSTIYGMPKAAASCGGAEQVLPLHEISEAVGKSLGKR